MSLKSLIAIAAIATIATFGSFTTAQADPSVDVTIGFGFGDMPPPPPPFWGDEPGFPHRPHHIGHMPRPGMFYGLNCKQARKVVRNSGYEDVRSVKCSGPVFTFEGWRDEDLYRIRVDMRGRIVRVTPLYASIQY